MLPPAGIKLAIAVASVTGSAQKVTEHVGMSAPPTSRDEVLAVEGADRLEAIRMQLAADEVDVGRLVRVARHAHGAALTEAPAKKVTRVQLKRLDEQRERVAWMFERGDLDQSEYVDRMAQINADKQRLREAAVA